ncbi:DUF2076 domain-containing protein [Buchnera aphidicola]|uniref:DUF2076 domain-containing protein n=1 Tax=Buchnera aphidicola TaxID=9 RepID=UPI0034643442
MKDTEKLLIIELFNKLRNIENQTPEKDSAAEKMIDDLLKNHRNATYYMVQTLLVQDIIIKELTEKIKNLENKICKMNYRSEFLSGEVKNNIANSVRRDDVLNKKNIFSNQNVQNDSQDLKNSYTHHANQPVHNTNKISSFLGNALQTAVGVAGGIVAGNMLSDFFHHGQDLNHNTQDINSDHTQDSENHTNIDPVHNNFVGSHHLNDSVNNDTPDTSDHDDVEDFDNNVSDIEDDTDYFGL